MEDETSTELMKAATAEAKDLLTAALTQLKTTVSSGDANREPIFFRTGIEEILIKIEVSAVKVELRVAGPKAASEVVA